MQLPKYKRGGGEQWYVKALENTERRRKRKGKGRVLKKNLQKKLNNYSM